MEFVGFCGLLGGFDLEVVKLHQDLQEFNGKERFSTTLCVPV
jgi:hypothetical protein